MPTYPELYARMIEQAKPKAVNLGGGGGPVVGWPVSETKTQKISPGPEALGQLLGGFLLRQPKVRGFFDPEYVRKRALASWQIAQNLDDPTRRALTKREDVQSQRQWYAKHAPELFIDASLVYPGDPEMKGKLEYSPEYLPPEEAIQRGPYRKEAIESARRAREAETKRAEEEVRLTQQEIKRIGSLARLRKLTADLEEKYGDEKTRAALGEIKARIDKLSEETATERALRGPRQEEIKARTGLYQAQTRGEELRPFLEGGKEASEEVKRIAAPLAKTFEANMEAVQNGMLSPEEAALSNASVVLGRALTTTEAVSGPGGKAYGVKTFLKSPILRGYLNQTLLDLFNVVRQGKVDPKRMREVASLAHIIWEKFYEEAYKRKELYPELFGDESQIRDLQVLADTYRAIRVLTSQHLEEGDPLKVNPEDPEWRLPPEYTFGAESGKGLLERVPLIGGLFD